MLTSWKLGPALAAGNCVVLKPSEVTPLSSLKLGELIKEAGFPPGVVNILPGLGSVAGQAISDHRGVGKVSFTGSTVVGRTIMQSAGKSNLKRVALELGGKTPNIVFDDADLEQAIQCTAAGLLYVSDRYKKTGILTLIFSSYHAGQMCTSGTRIFVQEGIYDIFMQKFIAYAKTIQPGNGFNVDQNRIDPIVSKRQFDVRHRNLLFPEIDSFIGTPARYGLYQRRQGGWGHRSRGRRATRQHWLFRSTHPLYKRET